MGKLFVVFGQAGFFCGPTCVAGYKADRKAGLIYPPCAVLSPDGKVSRTVSILEYSRAAQECVYCGRRWKKERKAKSHAQILRHVDSGLEVSRRAGHDGNVVGKGLGF